MRYEDGRIDQFVSEQKYFSIDDRKELIDEFRQRGRDFFPTAVEQVKNQFTGEETDMSELPKEQAAYVFRAEEIAEHGYNWNEFDSEEDSRKKPSMIPLILVIAFMVIIVVSFFFGGPYAFGAFFLAVAALGFYAAFKGNARGYTHYGGTTSGSGKTAGLMFGFIGLAGVIPMFFYGKLGMSGTMILMFTSIFAVVGAVMLVGFFKSLTLRKKYSEDVDAVCVGYSRIIESGVHAGRKHHHHNGGFIIRTSPIFEYTYQGRSYKGLYDRMIDGVDADIEMGPAKISIDPDHPEDIYHKSARVKVQGLLVSFVCFALAAVTALVLVKGGFGPDSSGKKIPSLNLSGFKIFTLVFGSDEQREAIMESMGEGLIDSMGYKIPEQIDDNLVDQIIAEYSYLNGAEWYYELVTIEKIYEYDSGDYNLVFDDPAMPQLCKHGKHADVAEGDRWIVCYTIYEYEYEGEKRIGKDIFFDINAKEHTYVGSHGAYVIPE
ncbi:MAG: hypothetical protein IK001_04080 [Lachnospiraceae bacterium]|nr:hypothetical protein [Lachnospiraceae bacterium]